MDRWAGRVALVTGASSGIGAIVCRELVKNGLKVVGCARNVERIQRLNSEPDMKGAKGALHAVKCDLTKESDILSVFDFIRKHFGRIDVCINNAGFNTDCPVISGKTEDWRNMFDVNVLALCICTRESVKLMKEQNVKDGQIINVSSIAGHHVFDMNSTFYCGTKFMVRALTEGTRQELRNAKSSIRVCAISPGLVDTEFVSRWFQNNKESMDAVISGIGKGLSPDDIASAILGVLQSPPHVDINDIILRPIAQAL